jgi:hypothetical protein
MGRLTKPLSTLLEDLLVSAKTGLDHKKSSIFVAEKIGSLLQIGKKE